VLEAVAVVEGQTILDLGLLEEMGFLHLVQSQVEEVNP
jgi:hypothetical protein